MDSPVIFTFDEYQILSGIAGQDSPISVYRLDSLHNDIRRATPSNLNHRQKLAKLFRKIYREELLLDPNNRKVIICEDFLMSNPSKQLLSKVFLQDLLVPSISFVPSSVIYLLSCNLTTGTVINIGLKETTVIPIYDFHIITPQVMITERSLSQITTHIRNSTDLEDFTIQDDNELSLILGTTGANAISRKMLDRIPQKSLEESVRLTLFDPDYSKMNDDNELTIPEIMRKIITRISIDIRKETIENIVITGGLTLTPGFVEAFKHELLSTELSLSSLSLSALSSGYSESTAKTEHVLSSDDMNLWTTTSAYVSTIASSHRFSDFSIFANEVTHVR